MSKVLVPLLVFVLAVCASVGAVFAIELRVPQLAFTKICRIDSNAVLTKATVGAKAAGELHELHDELQSKVDAEKNKILSENLALPKNTKNAPDIQEQRTDLMRRWDDLQKEADDQSTKLNGLRDSIVSRLTSIAAPIISEMAKNLDCTVLLNQDAVKGGTGVVDITDLVIGALNARYTNISIDSKTLSQIAGSGKP